ncbi:nacht domain-containing protein [Fusarium phyllophilum]|uniref:Nacht domain-containing protein n=1 Tax=Fusarium phyllophilum TaxID=47803 RepID=A0A8H5JGX2_9HYPO|nr:nacht domain-containing protein [Fusarium phyllophilum]
MNFPRTAETDSFQGGPRTLQSLLQPQFSGQSNQAMVRYEGNIAFGSRPIASTMAEVNYSAVTPDNYTIAIICAESHEFDAIYILFDNGASDTCVGPSDDHNIYVVGRLANHHTVVVMPGDRGELDAGLCTQRLHRHFTKIELTFLVGVCGAIPQHPTTRKDIYLGDIIICAEVWRYLHNARTTAAPKGIELELRNLLVNGSSERVRQLCNYLRTEAFRKRVTDRSMVYLNLLQAKDEQYNYPGFDKDILATQSSLHRHRFDPLNCRCGDPSGPSCGTAMDTGCQTLRCEIARSRPPMQQPPDPRAHVGRLASADVVLRASNIFAEQFSRHNIIGVDMEGGGISQVTNCIVVKSAVDYADTHKNHDFKFYAAATAASFVKASLELLYRGVVATPNFEHLEAKITKDFHLAQQEFLNSLKPQILVKVGQFMTKDGLYATAHRIQSLHGDNGTLRGLKVIEPLIDRIEGYIHPFPSVFEDILVILAEVGQQLPDFARLSQLCRRSETAKYCLSLFFQDFLDIFATLLNLLCITSSLSIPRPLWSAARGKIRVIRSSIESHETLILGHADIERISEARRDRQALLQYDENKAIHDAETFRSLRQELKVNDYLPPLSGRFDIERGQWVKTDEKMKQWLKKSNHKKRCIWIRGIPGSGKTFLTRDIAGYLKQDGNRTLVAFLTHEQDATSVSVLQSLLFQAIDIDRTYMPLLQDLYERGRCNSSKDLEEILLTVLDTEEQKLMIIDGLDEVNKTDGGTILNSLLDLLSRCPSVRLLISSRNEYDIVKRLDRQSISLSIDHANTNDIKLFVERRGEEFLRDLEDRDVDKETLDDIRTAMSRIPDRANSMFLYARLIMDVVIRMGDVEKIRHEVNNLPLGLNEAYGRILSHIRNSEESGLPSAANRILQWLGKHPLDDEMRYRVRKGQLVLLQYAATEWLYHVKKCFYHLQNEHHETVRQALSSFFSIRLQDKHLNSLSETQRQSSFYDISTLNSLLRQSENFAERLLNESIRQETRDPTKVSFAFINVREALENIVAEFHTESLDGLQQTVAKLYGTHLYFCPWASCSFYRKGFLDAGVRQEHLKVHSRPLKCREETCEYSKVGFRSKFLLSSHEAEFHPTLVSVSLTESILPPNFIAGSSWSEGEQILADAVKVNQVSAVRVILGRICYIDVPRFKALLENAAASASGTMIEVLMNKYHERETSPVDLNILIHAAVKGRNLLTIRHIMQVDDHGYNPAKPIDRPAVLEEGLVTWDHNIVGILVETFAIELPQNAPERLFAGFAETLRYISDEEAHQIAAGMKKYIIWPSVYTKGVRASVSWRSPTWLNFFLENGGSPNDLEFGSVWEIAKSGTVASITIIETLLRYGSDVGTRFQGEDGVPPQKCELVLEIQDVKDVK